MLFSDFYGLRHNQFELDFVDVPIDGDILLFVDPFAISQRVDPWCRECNRTIVSFFQHVVDAIISHDLGLAWQLLGHFGEPNETRLGFSRGRPQGAGIGLGQSEQLLEALQDSSAVRTGFISALEEAEILIEGVGRDKISDLSTNVIRKSLAEYTREQCRLHNIATQSVPLRPYYSVEEGLWRSDYFELPIAQGKPVLLVPKAIVRYDPAYNHETYYDKYVLSYLAAEYIDANSSLVQTLKNGRRVVRKKALRAEFPLTKGNLYRFSRDHPAVMQRYRDYLEGLEKKGERYYVGPGDEGLIAEALITAIENIQPGNDSASEYHRMMIGVVEFLFFPDLLYPKKEVEINQGRKRIDITMENGAREGIFHELHEVRQLPCSFVALECKNYGRDLANPELDQIAGRFSPLRGKFGILCCRGFHDRGTFIERCRDTLREDRGLVIPLDDVTVTELLRFVESGHRERVVNTIRELVNEVWLS
jgi:hypothetical protein